MDDAASLISALESMIAGVLPAPTPSAGLPEEYAARTMPGPPVARIISDSRMIMPERGTVGSSIQPIMSAGAPASTAAFKTIFAASMVLFFARGCGEIIKPLRVFKQIKHLKIAVDVGFVVGITAASTPIGSAMRVMPNPSSRSITPQVFVSLYAL